MINLYLSYLYPGILVGGKNLKYLLLYVVSQICILHVKADCFILRSDCCSRALIITMPYLQRGGL